MSVLQKRNIPFIQPEGAFYFFIYCAEQSEKFAMELLDKEGIAVVPGSAYGNSCIKYYRISFAVDQDSFDRFLEWISSFSLGSVLE